MYTIYWLAFTPGLHGNWLGWFINKHSGFPDLEPLVFHNYDYSHPGSKITTTEPLMPQLDRLINKHAQTTDFNNICIRTYPNHDLYGYNHDPALLDQIYQEYGIQHIIVPTVNVQDCWFQQLSERLHRLRSETGENWSQETCDHRIRLSTELPDNLHADNPDIHIHEINLSALLDKDSNEYSRLLEAIQSQALPNWTDHIDDLIETVYR